MRKTKRFMAILLMMSVVLCGCGSSNKSGAELTDIEQFKCQDSIQTVFEVLGESKMEDNAYIGECYTYENLNLYGYNGKATFRVRDDNETIAKFECSFELNGNEFEDVLSQLSNKYGEYEKNEYSNQIAYVWEIPEDRAGEMGYSQICLSDYGNKKVIIDFTDEWSITTDEAYYNHLEEENEVSEKESGRETLLSEQYEFDGGTVDMMLSKDDESKYYYTISILSETPWKAAYAYYICSGIANSEKFKNVAEPSIMMGCGDVFISSTMSWKTNENRELETINGTQWISDTLLEAEESKEYSDEELEEFSNELTGFITEFISK